MISLREEIFPARQKRLFDILSKQSWIEPFYLAGGTSLALQIGHRRSIDFDFFSNDDFSNREIIEFLRNFGNFELFSESDNTIVGVLNDVRISFFKYIYPLVNTPHKHFILSIADKFDIALMKLEAISGRGSKKDFIDLYFLLRHFSISEILEKYELKYGIEVSNHYHLHKSMVYFDDAERQPMPEMLEKVSWPDIKNHLISKFKNLNFP